jgi:hypothetical protein
MSKSSNVSLRSRKGFHLVVFRGAGLLDSLPGRQGKHSDEVGDAEELFYQCGLCSMKMLNSHLW